MHSPRPQPRYASSSPSSPSHDKNILPPLRSHNLSEKLRGNHYPSSAAATELAQLVSSGQDELQKYYIEISRLQGLIVSIQNQKADLQTHVEMAQSLFSPIRKLPPEILSAIFLDCNQRTGHHKAYIPALALGSVSAYWRAVALATSSLWSNVRVDLEYNKRFQTPLFEMLLARSRNTALTIALIDPQERLTSTDIALLTRDCARWKSISLNPWPHAALKLALFPIQGHLPLLESLSIDDLDIGSQPIKYFQIAPKLTRLSLACCNRLELDLLTIPWS